LLVELIPISSGVIRGENFNGRGARATAHRRIFFRLRSEFNNTVERTLREAFDLVSMESGKCSCTAIGFVVYPFAQRIGAEVETIPFSPSEINSGNARTGVAITGMRLAMASIAE
jgi:hypothetical protein